LDILLSELSSPNPEEIEMRKSEQRFNIFLTNSLEAPKLEQPDLFTAPFITDEALQADKVKRDTPVMCIMGNPPYAVNSTNKSEWIEKLTADYKKDLNEKSYNSLSDDYVKFIRYGQHYIEKNGSGVLAYISNNSYVDGIVFRKMRKHLLECFDKIYILDLHGNSKKQETAPDGSLDQNVFDIMQGVSINIFIKTGKKKKNELGQLFNYDLFGKREFKYDFLNENNLKSLKWNSLENIQPNYFFVKKDFETQKKYNEGINISEIFTLNNVGFTSARDSSLIHFESKQISHLLNDLESENLETIRTKYNFGSDSRDYTIKGAIEDIKSKSDKNITRVDYRPFDLRYTHYSKKTKGFFSYPRWEIMQHFYKRNNVGLVTTRLNRQKSQGYFWISNSLIERHILDTAGDSTSVFPLYLYPDEKNQDLFADGQERTPNLNPEIVKEIAIGLGLTFTNEKETKKDTFAPIDILDYIYAVLHSPSYREKYKEFLKIDFPRVPYPKDKNTFWKLVNLGREIREIHLLESPQVEKYITQYPIDGDNVVTKPRYIPSPPLEGCPKGGVVGKVYINDTQYFDNVPEVAWNFYIGGYQPAQKWLKDRKDRKLEYEDILHYQKIIVALTETDRIMREIDKVEI
jgi:predicted helicase